MSNKIKVGVFGAARGKTMINILLNHPDAELVAVCDKYVPLLKEVGELAQAKQIKVALYESFDEFFKQDMDAVVLANYGNEHAPFAIRLLHSGRHVLSEVLPCETMSQAVALIEAVEKTGLVYSYAENYCYMNHTFEMMRRYQDGDIGDIMYAESQYIHDCSACWPDITYGERTHWRNHLYSTFYCTHSIGPVLTISGHRPVQVVGFETQPLQSMIDVGNVRGSAGVELLTLDNGAIVKSVHGALKMEPPGVNYEVYGTKGMLCNERSSGKVISYIEGPEVCKGERTVYEPEQSVSPELAQRFGSHGGSDFYATHFFLEKILGRPEGTKYGIDVYSAVDMGICGILAYRSILNGNQPVHIPNLRNKEEREAYRQDHACTNAAVAGEQLLPVCSRGVLDVPDETYARARQKWLDHVAEKEEADHAGKSSHCQ
ncbi:MAG: Gfo/Idh/MocA family oxidoreductase [Clostridiaceae bacterium]|nr:Gfo/Idh/MocA family oxidoreductase [Clostridiaceae bacterium]